MKHMVNTAPRVEAGEFERTVTDDARRHIRRIAIAVPLNRPRNCNETGDPFTEVEVFS
jgi:hypothetical protein